MRSKCPAICSNYASQGRFIPHPSLYNAVEQSGGWVSKPMGFLTKVCIYHFAKGRWSLTHGDSWRYKETSTRRTLSKMAQCYSKYNSNFKAKSVMSFNDPVMTWTYWEKPDQNNKVLVWGGWPWGWSEYYEGTKKVVRRDWGLAPRLDRILHPSMLWTPRWLL